MDLGQSAIDRSRRSSVVHAYNNAGGCSNRNLGTCVFIYIIISEVTNLEFFQILTNPNPSELFNLNIKPKPNFIKNYKYLKQLNA